MRIQAAGLPFDLSGAPHSVEHALSHLPNPGKGTGQPGYLLTITESPEQVAQGRRMTKHGPTLCSEDAQGLFAYTHDGFLGYVWQTHEALVCPAEGTREATERLLSLINAAVLISVIHNGGCAVHSSAVAYDDSAAVFMGRSGSGKTTVAARLCPPCRLIHDDIVVLRPEAGTWKVFPIPYKSSQQRQPVYCTAELAGLFAVQKSSCTRAGSLPLARHYTTVFANAYHLSCSSRISDAHMKNIGELSRAVPVKCLQFDAAVPAHELLQQIWQGVTV